MDWSQWCILTLTATQRKPWKEYQDTDPQQLAQVCTRPSCSLPLQIK